MDQKPSQYFRRSGLLPHVEIRRANHSSACYHTHTHDEFSVGVIDAGTAVHLKGSRSQMVHQGMMVMINPGDAHSCNPGAGQPWSYRMLFIEAGWIGRLQARLCRSASADYRPFSVASGNGALAYQHFDALFGALEREEDALGAEEALMVFLMTHCFDERSLRPTLTSQPQAQLGRARQLILDQLTDKLTLEDMAEASGLSPYHLIRSFKQAYGQTPHAFLLDQRINRAKQLLKRGHSMVEVALQLGFADQSHFQRNFKKRHALTPLVYQRALADNALTSLG